MWDMRLEVWTLFSVAFFCWLDMVDVVVSCKSIGGAWFRV